MFLKYFDYKLGIYSETSKIEYIKTDFGKGYTFNKECIK